MVLTSIHNRVTNILKSPPASHKHLHTSPHAAVNALVRSAIRSSAPCIIPRRPAPPHARARQPKTSLRGVFDFRELGIHAHGRVYVCHLQIRGILVVPVRDILNGRARRGPVSEGIQLRSAPWWSRRALIALLPSRVDATRRVRRDAFFLDLLFEPSGLTSLSPEVAHVLKLLIHCLLHPCVTQPPCTS